MRILNSDLKNKSIYFRSFKHRLDQGRNLGGGEGGKKIRIISIGRAIKMRKSNLLQLANNKQFVCMYIDVGSSIIHIA